MREEYNNVFRASHIIVSSKVAIGIYRKVRLRQCTERTCTILDDLIENHTSDNAPIEICQVPVEDETEHESGWCRFSVAEDVGRVSSS